MLGVKSEEDEEDAATACDGVVLVASTAGIARRWESDRPPLFFFRGRVDGGGCVVAPRCGVGGGGGGWRGNQGLPDITVYYCSSTSAVPVRYGVYYTESRV